MRKVECYPTFLTLLFSYQTRNRLCGIAEGLLAAGKMRKLSRIHSTFAGLQSLHPAVFQSDSI